MAPLTTLTPHPLKNRTLIATSRIPVGTLIASFASPLLALPSGPSTLTTCNYCLILKQPLRECTACRSVVYCSKSCQSLHWKAIHKLECPMLKRVRETVGKPWLPTGTRAVAQIMLLMKKGDEGVVGAFGDWKGERKGSLEGNVTGYREDREVWEDLKLQAMAGVVYAGLVESEEVVRRAVEVLCTIQTNAFNRLDLDTEEEGIFLDKELAMVNHSCVPNAYVGFDKRTAMLRADRDIAVGEEIEISYIDNTLPLPARQSALRLYHFTCTCPRCYQNLNVYDIASPTYSSSVIPLNTFSLQPDLTKFSNPPIDQTSISPSVIETVYSSWRAEDEAKSSPSSGPTIQRQWTICQPLVQARMFAVEPLRSTIISAVQLSQTDPRTQVYGLPLACLQATEGDPFVFPAPFMPFRVKEMMVLAKLLAETARMMATGELASSCSNKKLLGALKKTDQMSMCEGVLRLVVHWAPRGAAEAWEVFGEAREMLAEIESLEGREKESGLLRKWAQEQGVEDGDAKAFWEYAVLNPVRELAGMAVEIMDGGVESGVVRCN